MTAMAQGLEITKSTFRTRLTAGLILFGVAFLILVLFAFNSQPGQQATFNLNLAHTQAIPIPNLTVPVLPVIYVLILVLVFFGAFQLARGISSTGLLAAIIAFCFVAAF